MHGNAGSNDNLRGKHPKNRENDDKIGDNLSKIPKQLYKNRKMKKDTENLDILLLLKSQPLHRVAPFSVPSIK